MMRPLIAAVLACLFAASAQAENMRLAVTTTFRNSGLSDILLPELRKDLGINIEVIVVGTGQALALARAGDVEAILVHDRSGEQALVAAGFAEHRREIMYNDFVLLGPRDDPAGIATAASATAALQAIATTPSVFISRGDDSGTHIRELALWQAAGISANQRPVDWYKAVGAGMGTALNIAVGLNAYILSDRASWLTFHNPGELALLFSGDPELFNQYTFLAVSPDAHPHLRHDLAKQVEHWLTSARARELIDGYRLNGQNLFTYNAQPRP